MLFMVIERFRNRDPKPIYRRLRDRGRQMPDGLKYMNSWIDPTFERCFQLMECDDARQLQQWIVHWSDLMDSRSCRSYRAATRARLLRCTSIAPRETITHDGRRRDNDRLPPIAAAQISTVAQLPAIPRHSALTLSEG